MIAARNLFGSLGPQALPALSEQSWLDWAVVDFNYQVEAFKVSATMGAAWADWRFPTLVPIDPPAPATIETEASDDEPSA